MRKKTISVKANVNQLLKELIRNQNPDVPEDKKLYLQDIQRICRNISTSPFSTDECCLWEGYITNLNKTNKGTYINFYFRHKKVALHRLLFANYVGPITNTDYLKYTCKNKGLCCNINHLEKFKYNKSSAEKTTLPKKKKICVTILNKQSKDDECTTKKLCIDFN